MIQIASGAQVRTGTGSPEGVVVGSVGDTFQRTDGGIGGILYLKQTGNGTNTGWVLADDHKVLADATDTMPGYLGDKLTFGPTINKAVIDVGGGNLVTQLDSINSQTVVGDNLNTVPVVPGAWALGVAPNREWYAIAYGNGRFVSIAPPGNSVSSLMASPSGFGWIENPGVPGYTWLSLCYGNGRFVSPAAGNAVVLWTVDGFTWNTVAAPTSNHWNAVAFGNDRYVAVAGGALDVNKIMWSDNATAWNTVAAPYDALAAWNCICHGAGKFVAVTSFVGDLGFQGLAIASSDGGLTWTSHDMPTPNPTSGVWTSVAYGNGKFVAVSSSTTGRNIATSYDGLSWTLQINPAPGSGWTTIRFGGGRFCILCGVGTWFSTDGIHWTQQGGSPLPAGQWWDVCYGNGLYVGVGGDTPANNVMRLVYDQFTPTQLVSLSDAPALSSAGSYGVGDPTADGSWRHRIVGNDLVFERRESGSWIAKGSFVP